MYKVIQELFFNTIFFQVVLFKWKNEQRMQYIFFLFASVFFSNARVIIIIVKIKIFNINTVTINVDKG